jgi:hypothetical protein
VRDHDIRTHLREAPRLILVEDVRAGQHLQFVGYRDPVDLVLDAHSGLLQALPEVPVDQADGREILDPVEPHGLQLRQKGARQTERVGATDSGQDRCVFDHRQHLRRHVHHDGVGVTVGHEPGEAAASRHPEAARVVDDDQVDATALRELRGDAGAGTRTDDRPTLVDLLSESADALGVGKEGHGVRSEVRCSNARRVRPRVPRRTRDR